MRPWSAREKEAGLGMALACMAVLLGCICILLGWLGLLEWCMGSIPGGAAWAEELPGRACGLPPRSRLNQASATAPAESIGKGRPCAHPMAQVEWTSTGLSLESAAVRAWGREPSFTNHTPSFTGCLDYVWLSRGDWQVVGAMAMPGGSEGGEPNQATPGYGPLPSATEPSDHVALGFCLRLVRAGGANPEGQRKQVCMTTSTADSLKCMAGLSI